MNIKLNADKNPIKCALLMLLIAGPLTLWTLPIWFYGAFKRRAPKVIDQDGFTLFNGTKVMWNELTSAQLIHVYRNRPFSLADEHLADQLELSWIGGRIRIDRQMFVDGDQVMRAFLVNLPEKVLKSGERT